ncbi:MAG: deoxyribonuclease V [Anaerolineales bacterium]
MPIPHSWNISPEDAVRLQAELAPRIDTTTPLNPDAIRYVAGVDVSVKDGQSRAAIVVLRFPELEIIEAQSAHIATPFPYIPGLLSFREGEVILRAQADLQYMPDVYLFDGMGIMHPRRLGIASHMGLWLDAPTIGIGKKRLLGRYEAPPNEKGSFSPLAQGGETLGVVLRTRANVKPVFVSVGHKATLDTTIDFVLRCTPQYRLPEPIRAAHKHAGRL